MPDNGLVRATCFSSLTRSLTDSHMWEWECGRISMIVFNFFKYFNQTCALRPSFGNVTVGAFIQNAFFLDFFFVSFYVLLPKAETEEAYHPHPRRSAQSFSGIFSAEWKRSQWSRGLEGLLKATVRQQHIPTSDRHSKRCRRPVATF